MIYFIFLLALILRLVAAYYCTGFNHPDEHFQILEPAYGLIHGDAYWLKMWEFDSGIRSMVLPYFFSYIMKFFYALGIEGGQSMSVALRTLMGCYSMVGFYYFYQSLLLFTKEKKTLILALFMVSISWWQLYFSVRTMGESIAIPLMLMSFYLFLKEVKENQKNSFWHGLLLGVLFTIRFQSALWSFGIGLVLLWRKKISAATMLVLGFLVVMMFFGAFDYSLHGTFLHSPLEYFRVNILEGVASKQFGADPWHRYITLFLRFFSLFAPVLLYFSFQSMRRLFIFWIPTLSFFLGHMMVSHKEDRFILPVLIFFLFFALLEVCRKGWILQQKKIILFFVITFVIGNSYKFYNHPWSIYADLASRFELIHQLDKTFPVKGVMVIGEKKEGTGGYYYLDLKVPLYFYPQKIIDSNELEKMTAQIPSQANIIAPWTNWSLLHQKLQEKGVQCVPNDPSESSYRCF